MTAGTGEQWVIDFTTQLYADLGGNYLITHARETTFPFSSVLN
jgi:hypothetical protein